MHEIWNSFFFGPKLGGVSIQIVEVTAVCGFNKTSIFQSKKNKKIVCYH